MNRVRTIVHCSAAHRKHIMGDGVGIAIMDTGLAPHPDYRSRITGWYDTLFGKKRPYDDSGHGSHVAGIAAGDGSLSHSRYTGIAPGASLVGVKVLDHEGNGYIAQMMQGLDWILHERYRLNIRVVNISIGANDFTLFHEGSAFVQKVNTLWDAGIVVVAAAGNKGPDRYTISAPGNSRKIITVGSSDIWHINRGRNGRSGQIAHSGTGPTLACIKKPDVVAPGSRIVSCSSSTSPSGQNAYRQKSGTSMSTPVVSGAIALLLCKYPEMTPKEVKIRLKNSSTDLHLPHEKQGWGLLNIEKLL